MHEPRYAFFDMDHTLTRADTGFAFLRWWARQHPLMLWRFLAAPAVLALWKLRLLSLPRVKNFFFSALRGQTAADMDTAAREFVYSAFDKLIKKEVFAYLDVLRPHYRLVLASASPAWYVPYFAERLGFEVYAATLYGFHDGKCTGRIEGEDCRGGEKVRRIQGVLGPGALERYDRAGSIAFSDNLSADAPMLALAGTAFRVHRGKWRLVPLASARPPRI